MTKKAPQDSNLSDRLRLSYQGLITANDTDAANDTDERALRLLDKNDIEKDYLTRAGSYK